MQCQKVQDLFSEMHEGTLGPGLRQAVQTHLDRCYDCRADYEGFVSLYAALGELPAVPTPEGLAEKIARRLDREAWEQRQKTPATGGWLKLGLVSAAAAAIFASIYFAAGPFRSNAIEAGPTLTFGASEPRIVIRDGLPAVVVDPGNQRRIQIADGSLVVTDETIPEGRRAEFPLYRKGDRPASVWIRVEGAKPMLVIVPSGAGSGAAGSFEGTLAEGLQLISEGFGFVVVATIENSPAILQKDFTGLDLAGSLQLLLEGTGYKFRSVGGYVEVR